MNLLHRATHPLNQTHALLAQRLTENYLRSKWVKTVENFEREARRMFCLEAQLAAFAQEYYATVGAAAERLAQLESGAVASCQNERDALGEALAHCTLKQERAEEMKSRYRAIAKEIHPDRAQLVAGEGFQASDMHALNDAYASGDLAKLLRCEAEMLLGKVAHDANKLETYLREIERATQTYASGYRQLLRSPLNELMLRAISAANEGWDWMDEVARRMEREIFLRESLAA